MHFYDIWLLYDDRFKIMLFDLILKVLIGILRVVWGNLCRDNYFFLNLSQNGNYSGRIWEAKSCHDQFFKENAL